MGKICLVTTLPLTFDAWGMYTCTCLRGAACVQKPVKPRLWKHVGGSYVLHFSYLCTFRRAPSCVCIIHDTALRGRRTQLFSMGWLPHSVLRMDTVHYRNSYSRFWFFFIVQFVTSSLPDCALFKSCSENNIILFSRGLFYSTHDNSIKVPHKD